MRAGAVAVDLLQEQHVRRLRLKIKRDAAEVLLETILGRGVHALPAVHKEVRIVAERAIADVPADERERVALGEDRLRSARSISLLAVLRRRIRRNDDFHRLAVLRLVLRHGQKDEQQRKRSDEYAQNNRNDFQDLFSHFLTPSCCT